MFRILSIIILILCPIITISQDLKFELLTKWESLTPEFPIDFGNNKNGFDLFNIGDFNKDGIIDVGLKTSKSSIAWDITLGGSEDDYANSIQQTSDGGYIIAGGTESSDGDITSNNGRGDYWILKLDIDGNIVWNKTYGGSEFDSPSSIQQTSDGGYVIAGCSKSLDGDISDGNNGDLDFCIVKLDSLGNKVWDKTFGGSEYDRALSIQQTSDKGYIISGNTRSDDGDVSNDNNGNFDYWVVKLDIDGNKIWDKTFGGSSEDYAKSIIQTSDGGYIVAGTTMSVEINNYFAGIGYCWVIKLDGNGNLMWDTVLGGSFYDSANSILQTSDGSYIVAGSAKSIDGDISDSNNGKGDCWIVKLDSSGNKVWDKTFGGTENDQANSIQQTWDGGFIVGGLTESNNIDITDGNNGIGDFWVIKLDSSGNKIWDRTIGGSKNEGISSIQQTNDGGYVMGGFTHSNDGDISNGNKGNLDFWIVKLEEFPNSLDSLYILTLNNNGSVNNKNTIVPEVPGFDYSGQRGTGFGGFGSDLVNMGDMDGNGTDDFIVSSPQEKLNDSTTGAFFVLFMHSDGSVKDFNIVSKSDISISDNLDLFAYSMAGIGDLDNDGINEVAVNTNELFSNNAYPDTSESGGVYVLFFNPDGSLKKWSLNTLLSFRDVDSLDVSSNTGVYALENAGDLDSNGVDDVLIDHFENGISILYLDSQGKAIDLKQISKDNPNIKAVGNYVGQTLSSIVDIDNDGNNEIISQFSTSSFDTVPLFTTGIISYNDSFSVSNFQLINPYDIDGVDLDVSSGESFGNRSVYMGDINSDGYPEIGILDMHKNNPSGNDGVVYIVSIKPGDCLETTCVWPGDANNDGVANCEDALSIGRGFNKFSDANKRILPVNDWIAQEAGDWGELNDGVDMKFSDCDGNGSINRKDIQAVRQNYDLTHQKNNTIDFEENGPVLSFVPSQINALQNDTAQFDILLGNPTINAENIFGLNMTIRPSSPELYESSIQIDYSDSWIGNIDSNAIHLEHQLSDGISFAIVRTDHKNTTNHGKIASVKIPLTSYTGQHEKLALEVTDLNIESHEGDDILVSKIVSDSIAIVDSTDIISSLNSISQVASYPNPTSGRVYFNLKDEIKNIEIYSSVGYLIKTEPINARSFTLNLDNLSDGTYFISLQGDRQHYQKSVTVKK